MNVFQSFRLKWYGSLVAVSSLHYEMVGFVGAGVSLTCLHCFSFHQSWMAPQASHWNSGGASTTICRRSSNSLHWGCSDGQIYWMHIAHFTKAAYSQSFLSYCIHIIILRALSFSAIHFSTVFVVTPHFLHGAPSTSSVPACFICPDIFSLMYKLNGHMTKLIRNCLMSGCNRDHWLSNAPFPL